MTRRREEDEEGGKDMETRWRRRMETRRGETTKGGGREEGGREMTKGGHDGGKREGRSDSEDHSSRAAWLEEEWGETT